jgi:hypothetical protein
VSEFGDAAVTAGKVNAGTAGSPGTEVQVYKLTTAVASPELVFPSIIQPASTNEMVWLSFMCDDGVGAGVACFMTFSESNFATAVPDPLANITAPLNITQQCIRVPADFELMRKLRRGMKFRAIQNSGADAYLRVEMVSPNAD